MQMNRMAGLFLVEADPQGTILRTLIKIDFVVTEKMLFKVLSIFNSGSHAVPRSRMI